MKTYEELKELFESGKLDTTEYGYSKEKMLCPIFQGFYDSILYNSDMIDDYITEKSEEIDNNEELDLDFNGYKQEVCERYAESYIGFLSEFVGSGKFSYLDSPMFYNYRTDDLYFDAVLKRGWKKKLLSWMFKDYMFIMSFMGDIYQWSVERKTFEYWVKSVEKEDIYELSMLFYLYAEHRFGKFSDTPNDDIAEQCVMDVFDNMVVSDYIVPKSEIEE